MIVVDANVLLYAYNATSVFHERARAWVEQVFSGAEQIGLPWIVLVAFIRIATDPRAHTDPFTMEEAARIVDQWLTREPVAPLSPGPRHWQLLRQLLTSGQARGPLATDAHIAAHALEHGAVVATHDRDFSRFEGLRLIDPLAAE